MGSHSCAFRRSVLFSLPLCSLSAHIRRLRDRYPAPYDGCARYRTRRNSVSHITRHQFGMTEKLDTVRAQFETLHQAYIAELPYKIQRAREIWELLPDEGWDG